MEQRNDRAEQASFLPRHVCDCLVDCFCLFSKKAHAPSVAIMGGWWGDFLVPALPRPGSRSFALSSVAPSYLVHVIDVPTFADGDWRAFFGVYSRYVFPVSPSTAVANVEIVRRQRLTKLQFFCPDSGPLFIKCTELRTWGGEGGSDRFGGGA